MVLALGVPSVIVLLFAHIIATNMKITVKDAIVTLFGICYVVGFILYIPLLFGIENGRFLIWYLLLAAWGTDTFAYIIGVMFGKHKFTKVSPKKSVEGSVAGIVGAVGICLAYTFAINHYTDMNISYWHIAIVSAVLSVLSQIGDLSASTIKRHVGIDDFGSLLPGHGGILDRIDSIIFIAPFAYFLLMVLI